MTFEERMLLKMIAGWVAEQEAKEAEKLGTTSNMAEDIFRLLKNMPNPS